MQAEKVRFPFVWACNFMNRIMTCKYFSFLNVKNGSGDQHLEP